MAGRLCSSGPTGCSMSRWVTATGCAACEPTGTEDNSLRIKAQALDNHVGKTLRLKDDGTASPDNPFVGRAGAKPEIFTYGHRNGYGLSIHPETGQLWQAEIGPLGGDEVNMLVAGHNYGWPVVSMGRNYAGASCPTSRGSATAWTTRACSGCRRSARRACSSTTATGSRAGRAACSWAGSRTARCSAYRSASRRRPSGARRCSTPLGIRPRDIQVGPDGNFYVATEGASGGQASDGMVLQDRAVELTNYPTSELSNYFFSSTNPSGGTVIVTE